MTAPADVFQPALELAELGVDDGLERGLAAHRLHASRVYERARTRASSLAREDERIRRATTNARAVSNARACSYGFFVGAGFGVAGAAVRGGAVGVRWPGAAV